MQNVSILKKAFTTPSTRRAIMLGCLLQLFQQVAGINTVMYYSAKIISLAGISDDTTAIWISAGVASVNFLCTFIGLFLVERIGRRKLLLGSMLGKEIQEFFFGPEFFFFGSFSCYLYFFVGVCLSLAFLAIGFQLADTNTPLVTVIESNGDHCSSYTVSQFIHES